MSNAIGSPIESEKYNVLRELGRGGMGVVYLAEDRQLRRQVALKVLYDYLNRDQAFVERFQEEARSVSTLHHPNIVCVHGLERAGETVAIDMELVEGVSLDQVSGVSPHSAAAIARDVLSGLAACHQIGVVHRDIKPSNILLNQSGQAKITDFGLATAYASHMETTLQGGSSSGFYMGTPRYMPIQAWEGGRPEPIWDLYSFGVVLHEVISGQPAFKGDNPLAIMRKQLAEPLLPLHTVSPQVSEALSQLVDSLLNSCRPGNGLTCTEAFDLLRASPEFKALQESDSASTLPALRIPKRRRNLLARPARLARAKAGVVVALLALAIGLYALLNLAPLNEKGDIPRPGFAFYAAQPLDGPEEGVTVWMVEVDETGTPVHLSGASELSLFSLDVHKGEKNEPLKITGGWGARFSKTGRPYHGTTTGILSWNPPDQEPLIKLTRTRDADLTEAQQIFNCTRKAPDFGRVAFYEAIEENSVLQTLLYRDLLPRGLDWAVAIEAQLPVNGARVKVPSIAESITIDGKLNENTWNAGAFDPTGRVGTLASQDSTGNGVLEVRWDKDAAYIAARATGIGQARFEIGIAPGVQVDAMEASRFFLSVDAAGTVRERCEEGGIQKPWTGEWAAKLSTNGDTTCVEFRIPAASLKEDAMPANGRRWRMNARFSPAEEGGRDKHMPWWGRDDLEVLEHGALLVFQPPPE